VAYQYIFELLDNTPNYIAYAYPMNYGNFLALSNPWTDPRKAQFCLISPITCFIETTSRQDNSLIVDATSDNYPLFKYIKALDVNATVRLTNGSPWVNYGANASITGLVGVAFNIDKNYTIRLYCTDENGRVHLVKTFGPDITEPMYAIGKATSRTLVMLEVVCYDKNIIGAVMVEPGESRLLYGPLVQVQDINGKVIGNALLVAVTFLGQEKAQIYVTSNTSPIDVARHFYGIGKIVKKLSMKKLAIPVAIGGAAVLAYAFLKHHVA